MQDNIIVKGAREHNLKNIDISLPRNKLVVVTGLSGSGKSTLVFDTIYAEGQRRYVESLSAYARQFLGQMNKPDVDSIDGLSPAIAIEQKTTSKNPRSTVGTVTEIYDYLRLLFARVGEPHCPNCGNEIKPQSKDSIVDTILRKNPVGTKLQILAPVIRSKKGTYEALFKKFADLGFVRVRVDTEIKDITEEIKLDKYVKHNIEIIVDRIQVEKDSRQRVMDSVEQALSHAAGLVMVLVENKEYIFSQNLACEKCQINFEELQPRHFSFNSPFGACETCHGLGFMQTFDQDLVIPDKTRSILEGAVAPWRNQIDGWRIHFMREVAKAHKFSMSAPFNKLSKEHQNIILYGSDKEVRVKFDFKGGESSWEGSHTFEGIIPQLQRLYKQTESEHRKLEMEKFMINETCPACIGKRLKPQVLAVLITNKSIHQVTELAVKNAILFFENLKLNKTQTEIAKLILKEIKERLLFLSNVGLDYLTLNRAAGTLSGGEAQRIRLATQIGANLTGVLYVLDEPSIGLHQRDNNRLISTLHNLRDLGNTLIVVEHDWDTIMQADYVVDIGPGAGIHGGKVIAQGSIEDIKKAKDSITGQYLTGKKSIAIPKKRRSPKGFFEIMEAQENNLKNINVKFPIGVLCCITGVSGSGKSTLVNEILYKALMQQIYKSRDKPGKHKEIKGLEKVDNIIAIDQSPIGRTPRSNPATYTKVFGDIREIFAKTPEAKMRGYKDGRFSFNVKDGRCDNCEGDGVIKIEMHFLPDVYVECEECKGKRYNKETLEVHYKGKTIADVLAMSVEEALTFFENIPTINRKLQTLFDVGLGYIKLGQSATTLSGGEAQRVKLTSELAKRSTGNTVYILDEPTTGLHFDDVSRLLLVLTRLVEKGNTIVCIEHNLDVIKTADYLIDLGPEGGDGGGEILVEGTPEQVADNKKSYTGKFLKKVLAT